MSEPFVILGGGGHARVVLDVLRCLKHAVAGVVVPDAVPGTMWHGVPVLGADPWLETPPARAHRFAVGIGHVPGRSTLRQAVYARLVALGLRVPPLVHPAAVVAASATLGAGGQIMAGAVVQPGADIGENALINTGARVDHDCRVGRGAHVAPGAILCGDVRVGDGAFIGAGAVLLPGVSVGDSAEVAAGAVVRHDVPARRRYIPGHPFKPLENDP